MNKKLLYILSKMKMYLLVLIPLFVLVTMSYFGLTKYDINTATNMIIEYLKESWMAVPLWALILAVILWILLEIISFVVFRKMQEERKKVKEKAEIKDLRYSVNR